MTSSCTASLRRPTAPGKRQSNSSTKALQRRNALVESHRHLVPPLAHHYWKRCPEPQDDLLQVGLLGLIRAAELFRPSHQTPFTAFARPHIRGAILHYLRDDAALVRLPRRQSEMQTRLLKMEASIAGQTSAAGTREDQICRELRMTAEDWQLLQRHRKLCHPLPLDGALLEQLPHSGGETLEDGRESEARMERLLARLDPRSQQVLRWVVLQGWSYRRAAAALDVSAMTVQRCLHRALATLRGELSTSEPIHPRPKVISSAPRIGRAPSVAQGWPAQHSPPPIGAPTHRARR